MTTRLCTARKPRRCDGYRCPNTIGLGELYVRHVTFPGQEGHEEGTRPVVHHECEPCVNRRGEWIAIRYGVPAVLGGRVEFCGAPGRIVNFAGGHLVIRTDDGRTIPTHPRWDVTYGEAS